jgi:tetratricopeptide (TPR) repeat protein
MSGDDDDSRTRRWQKISRPAIEVDPLHSLRAGIAKIRQSPRDGEARRQLRALAAEQGLWEQLALLLSDEARAMIERPEVAAAFYEELADVHENLDQPLEMITAMEAVCALAPGDVEHHDRLARLYDRAGAWQKAAEAFSRVATLARDDRARAALRAAGRIYREHARPDQAIEVYRGVVARKPGDLDAWRALDELLSALGRWREVADVRGELAARAASNVDMALLLRQQARAFEQAGDAAAAAELVARATKHAPDNVSGVVDYASVLARGGKGREAADVLAARVREAIENGAPPDEIAALRLRLVTILDDSCEDHVAAGAVLETLLSEMPEYLPALERLVVQASRSGNARAHGQALLRQIAAIEDPIDQAALLVEAGRRFREAGDHREAVRAFDRATALVPDDTLQHELDDELSAVAVERAAGEVESGELGPAERRLRAILETRPLDLPANLALVDLLEKGGRLQVAADHLHATLADAGDNTPPVRLAPLVHRYALVTAALGDDDGAHQLLHEAHHLDRRALLITLALGESCFRRKLWRETTIHLGALADHPDAAAHSAEVAQGLVLAGRAEVRALRPANAGKHYEAAVRIDPSCAPAWRALAELAKERDDTPRAVECLEREAAATREPKERARLAEAVGDLALDALGDSARAERCYARAVDVAGEKLLTKLLGLQRKRGAPERGQTCERLAELASDSRVRKDMLEEAAEAFASGGDLDHASALAGELADTYPEDIDAIACASGIALAAGDHAFAARWLRRALGAWDAAEADLPTGRQKALAPGGTKRATGVREGDPRRADLWRRLGDAERARRDERAAQAAYQRAVQAAPDSDGALAARRGLVELAASAGRPAGESLAALVEADPQAADVLAHARELHQRNEIEDARAMYELAIALGAKLSGDDERAVTMSSPRSMASDEAYAPLPEADRRALVDDEADQPLADLCDLLGEAASLVVPDARSALEEAGLRDARRVPPTSDSAAASMYPQIANALVGPPTLLYATMKSGFPDATVLLSSPPIVALGPKLATIRARTRADTSDPRGDLEVRFKLGRVVELARARRMFATALPDDDWARMVAALHLAFGRADTPPSDRETALEAERLRKAMPVQLRRRMVDFFTVFGAPPDPAAYSAACQRAADRAGLLVCGHAGIAIALAGGAAAAPHLVRLAASPRYLAARRALRRGRA